MDKISRSVMEAARARVLKYIRRSQSAMMHTDMNLTQAAAILSAHNVGIAAVVDEPEPLHLCDRCKHSHRQSYSQAALGWYRVVCKTGEHSEHVIINTEEKLFRIMPDMSSSDGRSLELHITECKCFAENA